jgi:putative tricarboxylic transport membrane protein
MSEIVFGVIFALLSLFFFLLTFRFPELTIALSPTVFPRFVTVGLFILSMLLLVQGLRKHRRARRERMQTEGAGTEEAIARRATARRATARIDRAFALRFAVMAALALLYSQVVALTGYLVATPPFVAGAMLLFGERKWYRVVLVSVVTTAILYGVFRMVFRVPLPRFSLW